MSWRPWTFSTRTTPPRTAGGSVSLTQADIEDAKRTPQEREEAFLRGIKGELHALRRELEFGGSGGGSGVSKSENAVELLEDIEKLVNRVIEKGLPSYLLREIDLVVFPRHVDDERYVGRVVELLSEAEAEALDGEPRTIRKDGSSIYYNEVLSRTADGEWTFAYDHPKLGDPVARRGLRTFDRIASLTDRPVADVEAEFHRKHDYVEYLVREGVTDLDRLFGFLADLRTNEAATVERIQRRHSATTDD